MQDGEKNYGAEVAMVQILVLTFELGPSGRCSTGIPVGIKNRNG